MRNSGVSEAAGNLGLRIVRTGDQPPASPGTELSFSDIVAYGFPQKGLPSEVNAWRSANAAGALWRTITRQVAARAVARKLGLPYLWSQLFLTVIRADGRRIPYGLAGCRVVTDAGVAFIVDAFQNLTEPENMKYHGIGTGSTAEAAGDTALATELTTQYNPDNTRATGTTAEGASANIYQTVGTNTVDAAVGIQEHGIFDQAAVGGGTLLDRTVFAVVNLSSGDSLESTYELTLPSGS